MPLSTSTQHKLYVLLVMIANALLVLVGLAFPFMNIIIVGLPHFRDMAYVMLRITVRRGFVRFSPLKVRCNVANIVAVIPAYKEDPEEVELTLKSIGEQGTDDLRIGMVIVSDGFLDYHEIISDLRSIAEFEYTTYKKKTNVCTLLVGDYKGMTVVVAKKSINAGKKDSLILLDDILLTDEFCAERKALLNALNLDGCEFLFHTDADSVIGSNVMERQANILLSNPKIAGVAGLVLVPIASGFWNYFQGFQYYYGQVVRKASDSLWGKVTCLPGCITMMRAEHPAVIAGCERYRKLPSTSFIFQVKNRLQGTDRRYTNCILQHSRDTYLVVDMESDCYTIPPQSMEHFRSQRKRWTSNAITGNFFLLVGSNVPFYTRMLCGIDIFRIHTSLTRLICSIRFFAGIGDAEITYFQISMLILVLVLPYVFFLSTLKGRGKYGRFLFYGSLVSKLCSPFVTIYIFLYAMYYFNDLNWGKTHGSQPVQAEPVLEAKEVEDLIDPDDDERYEEDVPELMAIWSSIHEDSDVEDDGGFDI